MRYPTAVILSRPNSRTLVAQRIVNCLFILGCLPAPAFGDWLGIWHAPPLTTAQTIRDLTPGQAQDARAVKLMGVVTNAGTTETGFYLQDATTGIFVRPTKLSEGLTQGDRIA